MTADVGTVLVGYSRRLGSPSSTLRRRQFVCRSSPRERRNGRRTRLRGRLLVSAGESFNCCPALTRCLTTVSYSRVASPPSPDFPHGSLPNGSAFPQLSAPESNNQNHASHSGHAPTGLTGGHDDYFGQNSAAQTLPMLGLDGVHSPYQPLPPHQQQYKQSPNHNDYSAYPSPAPPQQQQQYSLPPSTLSIPNFLPSNPTPPSSSVPGVASHLQLPANSPSLHGSTPYSPYRPSSSSLPSTSYPSQWAFNSYGFPSISPQYEKQDPFALGQGEMENWVGGSGSGSWAIGGGAGMGGEAWEQQQQQSQGFEGGQRGQWEQQGDGGGGDGKEWHQQ